jgi:hypothetical protein
MEQQHVILLFISSVLREPMKLFLVVSPNRASLSYLVIIYNNRQQTST